MEDYTEGNELRFLPCSKLHHFHIECVDPWLESNKSCPLCKRKIDEVALEDLPITERDIDQQTVEQQAEDSSHSDQDSSLEAQESSTLVPGQEEI